MEKINFNGIASLDAVHPGYILDSKLDEYGMSQKELALLIGKSTPVINDIIKGKRGINAEIAIMLETVFDLTAEEWLNAQCLYDISNTRKEKSIAERQNNIMEWEQIKQLIKFNELKKIIDIDSDIKHNINKVYEFAGVHNIGELKSMANNQQQCFKKSDRLKIDLQNTFLWTLMARHASRGVELKTKFERKKVPELINQLNEIFYNNKGVEAKVGKILPQFGIKYIKQDHLKQVPVDGMAFWQGNNPTIVITKRIDRIDNYAFTIMHELGHICKHLRKNDNADFIDSDKTTQNSDKENEANLFAQQSLVRDYDVDEMFRKIRNPYAAKYTLISMSKITHVNVSIITGQYQKKSGYYNACRDLLSKIN